MAGLSWRSTFPSRATRPSCSSTPICSPSTTHVSTLGWDTPRLGWRLCDVPGTSLRYSARLGESARLRATEESPTQLVQIPRKAADIVREFYDSFNRRDIRGVANLFTDDCVYEDFNYSESKRGRDAILAFFENVMSSFGSDLMFIIDDITEDDPNAVGVIWHLDWRGKSFPFSKGCSFYRCQVQSDGNRQIKYARDIVEPVTRPGDASMGILKLVTSLFERFPQLTDRF